MPELLDWYARVRRPLPWRFTRDPYALLVSEVMLQQTPVARVIPYWEAWLERWPDPGALAEAPLEDVLRAWSGLGYPRRAKALHAAAGRIAAHGWPEDLEELPGVGPYTAAAVASFAWDRPVAAVDVNAARVLSRLAGRELRGRALRDAAAAALERGQRGQSPQSGGGAAEFNQAMMELGATVCTARVARCDACPLASGCASAGAVVVPPRRPARQRFEDSMRYARGRVLRAHLHGEPDGLDPERRELALASLRADGLV